jgi:hypothetical protein
MQQVVNIPTIRKLSFSFDQASKRKFLQFLESIISFSNESLCTQFGFSKTDIVCKISKDHKFNYIAYFTYSVTIGRDNHEENSFKSYSVETSKDQICVIIDHNQLVKIRKIFKDISNAEEYFLTAKKQNNNNSYFEVVIPYGGDNLEFKEKIDFIILKSHIRVELFDREACFFTSLHGNYNLTSFIQFLDILAQEKDNSSFLKIQFGLEDGDEKE